MIKKKYVILIFFINMLYFSHGKAQYNYIISSFDYSSNTTTYGRVNTLVKQPSYSPGIIFFSKHGFDVSGLLYVLGNSDSTFENTTNEFDIMLGYEWEAFKNFIIYPSYSHFFYSKNSDFFKSGFSDNIQLDIDYSIKFFNTGVSGNYLFGENNTGLISFRNSLLIEKEDFILKNLYVAIQPGVDLTWGDQTYFSNEIIDKLKENPEQTREILKDYLSSSKVIDEIRKLRKIYPNLEYWDRVIIYINNQYEELQNFNLNAISLNLPAFFMIGSHFSLMFNLMYYKPINTPEYVDNSWKLYWSTGISFTFNL